MTTRIVKRAPWNEGNGPSPTERAAIKQDAETAMRKAHGLALMQEIKGCKDKGRIRCLVNDLLQIRVPAVSYRPTKGFLVRSGKRRFNIRAQQQPRAVAAE